MILFRSWKREINDLRKEVASLKQCLKNHLLVSDFKEHPPETVVIHVEEVFKYHLEYFFTYEEHRFIVTDWEVEEHTIFGIPYERIASASDIEIWKRKERI